jgi:hypothetical protein
MWKIHQTCRYVFRWFSWRTMVVFPCFSFSFVLAYPRRPVMLTHSHSSTTERDRRWGGTLICRPLKQWKWSRNNTNSETPVATGPGQTFGFLRKYGIHHNIWTLKLENVKNVNWEIQGLNIISNICHTNRSLQNYPSCLHKHSTPCFWQAV